MTKDALVVGAGVVGLASALSLARRGYEVLIAEADSGFGGGVSSRSSEVIHAGLYYPEGSLKARLCVSGRRRLYQFCEERGVPHRRTGKLVFAHDEGEIGILQRVAERAAAAGVEGLQWLSGHEAAQLEPNLSCAAALHSPVSGIVDSHALMLAMLAEIEALGGRLVCRATMKAASWRDGSWEVRFGDDPDSVVPVRVLVNAAGLAAQEVAGRIDGLDTEFIPRRILSRGCYFGYSGRVPFERLIYPVPVPGGLGTHLTFDLAGRARFGPDVQPIEEIDYSVDPGRRESFAAAARRIWPDLDADRLYPDYAGIRPKIAVAPGKEPDFVIAGPERHGLVGLALLFGIESPGLTASLAIGEEVADALEAAG